MCGQGSLLKPQVLHCFPLSLAHWDEGSVGSYCSDPPSNPSGSPAPALGL